MRKVKIPGEIRRLELESGFKPKIGGRIEVGTEAGIRDLDIRDIYTVRYVRKNVDRLLARVSVRMTSPKEVSRGYPYDVAVLFPVQKWEPVYLHNPSGDLATARNRSHRTALDISVQIGNIFDLPVRDYTHESPGEEYSSESRPIGISVNNI